MKPGSRVMTEHGIGTVMEKEAEVGFLSNRYRVRLENGGVTPKRDLSFAHGKRDGLYFMNTEMKPLNDE